MTIIINGAPRTVSAATLAALLAELGYASTRVATALGGEFVPRTAREDRPLREGDVVEILAPMQGG